MVLIYVETKKYTQKQIIYAETNNFADKKGSILKMSL